MKFNEMLIQQMDMQQGHQEPQQINTLNYSQFPQSTPAEKLKAAINLAETMPPSKLRKNLVGLITLTPQIEDILLEKVDQPLQVQEVDQKHIFLKTEFNRDGDSYRSPLTNTYYPQMEGGYKPTGQFRRIEELGNQLFSEYVKLYYGTGVGSFFVAEGGSKDKFSCGFFAKKALEEGDGFVGNWDSFNIIDIQLVGDEATFSLYTTILIQMNIQTEKQGLVDFTGFLKQQKKQRRKLGKQKLQECIVAVGEMVEQLQTVMRQHLQLVYISKTKQIIYSTRMEYTVEYEKQRRSLAEGLKQIHLGK